MKRPAPFLAMLPLLLAAAPAPEPPAAHPAPSEIVAAAPAADWVAIAPSDLMVMDLAPDAKGRPRRVVIQLMPPPFSQGWVSNIRKLVAARWYDGVSVNRVQDNYVAQWGDASETKPLPDGLVAVSESDYEYKFKGFEGDALAYTRTDWLFRDKDRARPVARPDSYAHGGGGYFDRGWQLANDVFAKWPVHCYGMVGVGRGMPPDTGTGAELYAVIGHAPRHLDRNIALVGRVIEGIEHLSSLPRGTGPLGFYETAEERVPILSVRMGQDVKGLPGYQYLSTDSTSFSRYANARANRRDPFFIRPAGGADICNIPVPVRRKP